jgi:hypothetical protein
MDQAQFQRKPVINPPAAAAGFKQSAANINMNIEDYTQEEIDALEEQTGNIAASLTYIENHQVYQGENLEELEERLANICASLQFIEEHSVYQTEDLEALEKQTDAVAANLRSIEEHSQNG